MDNSVVIRPGTPHDVPAIVDFIRELADYEKALEKAVATIEQLNAALFGPQPALYAHMACDDVSGEPVGFAIWFLNFSTWRGVHGIYLEDLYVRPAARGGGHGRALLAELARIAVERGYWDELKAAYARYHCADPGAHVDLGLVEIDPMGGCE